MILNKSEPVTVTHITITYIEYSSLGITFVTSESVRYFTKWEDIIDSEIKTNLLPKFTIIIFEEEVP